MKSNFKKIITACCSVFLIIAVAAVSLAMFKIIFNNGAQILDSYESVAADGEIIVKYAYTDKKIKLVKNEIQRTGSSYLQFLGEKRDGPKVYKMTSYSGTNFYKDGDKWYQVEYATTTKENFVQLAKPSLLARIAGKAYAVNIFAGAGDGRIIYSAGASWAIAHDAASGTGAAPTAAGSAVGTGGPGTVYYIYRGFLPFDTSSIPANAKVVSASVAIYLSGKINGDNDGDDWINIFRSSQATHTTLAPGDFDTIATTTEGAARIDFGSITNSTYSTWTLNASGMAWIAKSGVASACSATAAITCLGFLEGHDAINSAIATNATNTFSVAWSETTGTAQDPYLTVIYEVPGGIGSPSSTIKTRIKGLIRFMGGTRFK